MASTISRIPGFNDVAATYREPTEPTFSTEKLDRVAAAFIDELSRWSYHREPTGYFAVCRVQDHNSFSVEFRCETEPAAEAALRRASWRAAAAMALQVQKET